MAERLLAADTPELRERWGNFAWDPENATAAAAIIAKYPAGRQQSAVIPLLDLAQRQVGDMTNTQGWLPIPVQEFIAAQLGMAPIQVMEVATFYTMFNLHPVGDHLLQVCTTTPCWLRGSADIVKACKKHIHPNPHTVSADGKLSWMEVECLGACVNAPMLQIGKDFYEDLDGPMTERLIEALRKGKAPKPGSHIGRHSSEPIGGATTLTSMSADGGDPNAGG
jgi:NADH-quinone oxidoreductase subunit E